MEKFLAISGKSGLFKVIAYNKQGIVIENLENKERTQVAAKNDVSLLSEIQVYTDAETIKLVDVLKKIMEKENNQIASIDPKSSNDILMKYFTEILPNFDRDKVYASHIKKMITWYNILQKTDNLNFEE